MRRRALIGAGVLIACAAGLAPAQARMYGRIAFEPCQLSRPGGVERIAAECARFGVPEDPQQPDGRQLALRIAWLPARLREAQADPVVLLAGGPGQAAVDAYLAAQGALEPLRRSRHIILVDQRGTGGSHRLDCTAPQGSELDAATPAALQTAARRCLEQNELRADLRHYTTAAYLRDLEAVRAALGVPAFNLVGVSYGTRVALEYLRRHPDAVRSVVLDSPVPPELPLLQEHARNLDAALRAIFDACTADAACRVRFGDPASTLAGVRTRLAAAPRAVDVLDPHSHALRRETLSATLLAAVVRLYAYQPESAALLPLLLDEAAAGRAQPLMAQALLLLDQVEGQMAHALELSVVCAEDVPFLEPDPLDRKTLLGDTLIAGAQAQCAVWPRGTVAPDFKTPVQSDKPVLILSGERDPVTPPRYGERIAATLTQARHVVAPGQGHAVMMRGCMPRLVRDFVDEPAPQALDVSCVETMGAWPAFVGYQGPGP